MIMATRMKIKQPDMIPTMACVDRRSERKMV